MSVRRRAERREALRTYQLRPSMAQTSRRSRRCMQFSSTMRWRARGLRHRAGLPRGVGQDFVSHVEIIRQRVSSHKCHTHVRRYNVVSKWRHGQLAC